MTVIEATRKLIAFYTQNDVYDLKKDFLQLVTISEDERLDKAVVNKALETLEQEGFVASLPDNLGTPFAYVLKKPLAEYSQSIELNFNTIVNLTNIVNDFCDDLGIEKGRINPLNITESDIQNVLIIVETLKQQVSSNEDEDYEEEEEEDEDE